MYLGNIDEELEDLERLERDFQYYYRECPEILEEEVRNLDEKELLNKIRQRFFRYRREERMNTVDREIKQIIGDLEE